jgi:hypothetical protein
MKDVIRADNTGTAAWTCAHGTETWDFLWYKTGENTYFTTYTVDSILVTMQPDGTAKDNYGLTYIRS